VSFGYAFRLSQRVKGSLWVLPALGAIVGAGLAELMVSIEGSVHLPAELTYTPATATAVLSGIVAAMVGLTGFVVTIGVLIVQMASQTLSPRYMRIWYRDLLQKLVLALFVGTLTLAFGLLRNIGEKSVPNLGVSIAGVSVAVGLVLFIVYLDRFVHRLRPAAVSALVGRSGQAVFRQELAVLDDARHEDLSPASEGAPSLVVCSKRGGTVQAADLKGLLALAKRSDGLIVLTRAVGDFVPDGSPLMRVYGGTSVPSEKRLRGLIAVGDERTIDQDPAFALRIIVDIALMALSPAVNAPTTAVQVIDYVEEFLQCVGVQEVHDLGVLRSDSGRGRVVIPRRTWSEYLALGVTEILEYGETSTQTTRRLRAMLDDLMASAPASHRPDLQAQLERFDTSLKETISDPERRAYASRADPQGIGGVPVHEGNGAGPGASRAVAKTH
jgi:uncharacterized membrane protein